MAFLLLQILVFAAASKSVTMNIYPNKIIREIPDRFIGFNLDYWENNTEQFGNSSVPYIDFLNTDLITLTKALSPAVLRVGGSGEDSVIYNISGECNDSSKWNVSNPSSYYCSEVKPENYFCLNTSRWQQILHFVQDTNLKLVFGLNACYGRPSSDNPMDMSNIDALLQWTVSNGYNISNLFAFEFGNGMDKSIDAQAYSYDFIRLHTLVHRYFENVTKSIPMTVGLDDRYSSTNYANEVLMNMNNGTMNALNYHQYVNCAVGQKGVNESILDLNCLQEINEYANMYQDIVLNDTHQMNTSLWIGESALHSGGGRDGITNVFLSSFYFIFQLCELVQHELMDLVLRQTLSGGYYELINGTNNTFVPNPDYFILWFWRQLIGDNVIDSVFNSEKSEYLNGYAFEGAVTGEVTVVLINFSFDESIHVQLDLDGSDYTFEEYHMNGSLNSSVMYVNNEAFVYKNGKFPMLNGVAGNGNVEVAASTIVWIRCSS